jgi:hypothetical protein
MVQVQRISRQSRRGYCFCSTSTTVESLAKKKKTRQLFLFSSSLMLLLGLLVTAGWRLIAMNNHRNNTLGPTVLLDVKHSDPTKSFLVENNDVLTKTTTAAAAQPIYGIHRWIEMPHSDQASQQPVEVVYSPLLLLSNHNDHSRNPKGIAVLLLAPIRLSNSSHAVHPHAPNAWDWQKNFGSSIWFKSEVTYQWL